MVYLCWLQGGAIAYAAAVASAYGVKACVVTAAGPDADLAVFSGHELHVVPTNSTLTFEHSYTWWGEYLAWSTRHVMYALHQMLCRHKVKSCNTPQRRLMLFG